MDEDEEGSKMTEYFHRQISGCFFDDETITKLVRGNAIELLGLDFTP